MERDSISDDAIRDILSLRRIVAVGMSGTPSKAAHLVPKYLSENGYDVTPVNPNTEEILGIKSHDSISDVEGDIDIVNVFRPSGQVPDIIKDTIKKRPRVIWLQEGIHSPDAEKLARDAGICVVFNRCMMAEHMRLVR